MVTYVIWFAFLEEPAGFVRMHVRRGKEFHSCSHPRLPETLCCATQQQGRSDRRGV